MDGNGEEKPGKNNQLSAFERPGDMPTVRENQNKTPIPTYNRNKRKNQSLQILPREKILISTNNIKKWSNL